MFAFGQYVKSSPLLQPRNPRTPKKIATIGINYYKKIASLTLKFIISYFILKISMV